MGVVAASRFKVKQNHAARRCSKEAPDRHKSFPIKHVGNDRANQEDKAERGYGAVRGQGWSDGSGDKVTQADNTGVLRIRRCGLGSTSQTVSGA